LAALSQFIFRLANQALPFFKLLWKFGPFIWTEEAEEAFQDLNRYLTSPPIMVAPKPGERLLLYITATMDAMSTVLVMERPDPKAKEALGSQPLKAHPVLKLCEGTNTITEFHPPDSDLGTNTPEATGFQLPEGTLDPGCREPPEPEPMELDMPDPPGRVQTIQRPVYYINEVLHDAKIRYLEVHKLLYVVLISSRKFCYYFQAHKTSVVSSYPLRVMLHNLNASGNIAKWAAELAEFELDFITRHVVKSQVLADFVADWMPPPCHPGGGVDDGKPEIRALIFTRSHWTLFFDGSS
jgi:hypothetical protein